MQVTAVEYDHREQAVHNLTINTTHTYSIYTGPDTTALTHNCGTSSSRKLGDELEASGVERPAETAAHHIVAGNAKKAAPGREVLDQFGIDINDAANGVFLPKNMSAANPTGAAIHSKIHTNQYYDSVNEALASATSMDDAIGAINIIRQRLLAGSYP